MKPMREKIQTKLNSMASILLDDILVPEQDEQEGNQTIEASFYDKKGNKFTFNLSLTVVPKVKDEDPEEETPLTIAEQVSTILTKITGLEADVALLKSYHNGESDSTSTGEQETPIIEGPTNNEGSDNNGDQAN